MKSGRRATPTEREITIRREIGPAKLDPVEGKRMIPDAGKRDLFLRGTETVHLVYRCVVGCAGEEEHLVDGDLTLELEAVRKRGDKYSAPVLSASGTRHFSARFGRGGAPARHAVQVVSKKRSGKSRS